MLYCDATLKRHPDTAETAKALRGARYTNLIATREQELLEYGVKIGMKDFWMRRSPSGIAYFQVAGRFLQIVLDDDTVSKLDTLQFQATCRQMRADLAYEARHK